jgi:hypothetical protein
VIDSIPVRLGSIFVTRIALGSFQEFPVSPIR